MLTFEWDNAKNVANLAKHGITFEEATEVFLDSLSITIPDPDHSITEQRFAPIGMTLRGMIVVVVHTDAEEAVRIISARRAISKERRNYETT